jgi:transposase-like protein
MKNKSKRARYTQEFKLEAVRLVKTGQSQAVVSATLGIADQTLYNWVKAISLYTSMSTESITKTTLIKSRHKYKL